MKDDCPPSLSQMLGLTEWSIVCHPDLDIEPHRKSISEIIVGYNRATGCKMQDDAPVVRSEHVPAHQILLAGPAEDPEERATRWNTVKEIMGAE